MFKRNPNYPLSPEDLSQLHTAIAAIMYQPRPTGYCLRATAAELIKLFPAHLGWADPQVISEILADNGCKYSAPNNVRRYTIPLSNESMFALAKVPNLDIRHRTQIPYSEVCGFAQAVSTLTDPNGHETLIDFDTFVKAFPHLFACTLSHKSIGKVLTRFCNTKRKAANNKWCLVLPLSDEAAAMYTRAQSRQ